VPTNIDGFDPEWYLKRYPDVERSGLSPAEHYKWLGRRLGRLGARAPDDVATVRADEGETAKSVDPYDNAGIANALKRLCNWLFPTSDRYGFTANECAELVANHFWNDEWGGEVEKNRNGTLLVDFLSDFGLECKAAKPRRRTRGSPDSILLTSFYAPSRAHAGGLRILDLYEEIRERHPSIRLTLFCSRNPAVDGDISVLDHIFDDIFMCDPGEFTPETLQKLSGAPGRYGVVDLQFHQAGILSDGFRVFGDYVIYTPMEALARADFDAVRRQARSDAFPLDRFFSLIHRGAEERKIMQSVDKTVCVSSADAEFMRQFGGSAEVSFFPTGLSRSEFGEQLRPSYKPLPIKKRKNRLVFAAYFGSETNSVGLEWYLREVHPKVLAACPTYNLAVVGRGDTSKLERLEARSVSFIGEVPRLSPVLEQCKAGLVLALHGSGFRGKINQYALCGLPTVSTSLGATGLDYVDGEDILIGDSPSDFAEKCVSLLTKDSFTQKLGQSARRRALETYSWGAIWPRISPIYHLA